jgi:hypothetical protein
MDQSRRINLGIAIIRGCACASTIRITPRRDWSIGFKGGKGTRSWINLGIAIIRGCGHGGTGAPDGNGYTKIYSNRFAFAALKADGSITASRRDWPIGFKGGKGIHSWINLGIAITIGCTCASRTWTPLKPMAQSRRGVVCIGEVLYLQLHPTKIYSTQWIRL